ncbi:MAG TPA: hypothetical protein VFW28_04410 [Micropepsaceae bacterium]|nr:hypothetical protein [Micropepsaceae bacterium]
MRRVLLAISGFTALLTCASCAAQTGVSGTNTPQQVTETSAAAAAPGDPVICKTYPPPIGSLLAPRRICHTESDWNAITRDAQDVTNDVQMRARIERLKTN